MKRRAVLSAIAALAAVGRGARAEQPKRVAVLLHGGAQLAGAAALRDALAKGSAQASVIVHEGKGDPRSIEAAAREMEDAKVDVIVAFAVTVAMAAQRSTSRVPIVFVSGSDPVSYGLVESIARPGGRITGVQSLLAEVTSKRLALLQELVPGARRVISFYNPDNVAGTRAIQSANEAASLLGLEFIARETHSGEEVQARLSTLANENADAFLFVPDSLIIANDQLIVDAANALRIPTMSHELDVVSRGALAGYGISYRELGRQAGEFVIRILAGTHPSDLPVQSVTQLGLAINLKTAKALNLSLPPTLLARADEVIE